MTESQRTRSILLIGATEEQAQDNEEILKFFINTFAQSCKSGRAFRVGIGLKIGKVSGW